MASPDLQFVVGGIEPPESVEFAEFLARVDSEYSESLPVLASDRVALREEIRAIYGQVLDDCYILHDGAAEAINWAAETIDAGLEGTPDDDAFHTYHVLLRGLAAKSLLTFDEVLVLVEAGHREGAIARVRTMYELFVVAAVICLRGNPSADHPELVERFLAHREAFRRSDAGALLLTGLESAQEVIDAEVVGALDVRHAKLAERYGKPFMRNWGWAAPLFPGENSVSFAKLVDLIEPAFAYFYPALSAAVHAGSAGWHDSIEEHGDAQTFKAYPDADGLGFPIELATFLLLVTIDTVVPVVIEAEGTEKDVTGANFLGALRARRNRISTALEAVPHA